MPIVNHDLKGNQHAAIQRAHYHFAGTGTTTVEVPLAGPRQIRRIVCITGANITANAKTLRPLQVAGGDGIGLAKDINKAALTRVTWEPADLLVAKVKTDATFDSIAFDVICANGGETWSVDVEVLYSPRTNINNSVFLDEKVAGLT